MNLAPLAFEFIIVHSLIRWVFIFFFIFLHDNIKSSLLTLNHVNMDNVTWSNTGDLSSLALSMLKIHFEYHSTHCAYEHNMV